MPKNTGTKSQDEWLDVHRRLGKKAHVHRLVDAAEIRGKTGRVAVAASAQPSDYIRTFEGVTAYCEVKSTQSVASFPFSMLEEGQNAHAKMACSWSSSAATGTSSG